jgi:hypothetical protein
MKLDLNDYLPFYIGQKYRYSYVEEPDHFSPWHILNYKRIDKLDDLSLAKVQLLLRPVSDMNFREALEIYNEIYPSVEMEENRKITIVKNYCSKSGLYHEGHLSILDDVQYFIPCLKRGFDLFNLIENGLALDATKQY